MQKSTHFAKVVVLVHQKGKILLSIQNKHELTQRLNIVGRDTIYQMINLITLTQ